MNTILSACVSDGTSRRVPVEKPIATAAGKLEETSFPNAPAKID